MKRTKPKRRHEAEALEKRLLLASTSTLLQYDFNSTAAWPGMTGTVSAGGTATAVQGAYGTIDVEGGTTPSGAVLLTATPPSSGAWVSDLNSGPLAVSNTETNLGKLTLSFNLAASKALPVKVQIFSYATSGGTATGGLEKLIYPAAANYNQRFALDLSTMTPSGAGTFNPAAAFVSFNFEISSQNSWPAATTDQVHVDNVNYSKPAYYVSGTGSNSNNGLTESTAFATPAKAVSVSQPGDIILVMNGTYNISNAGVNAIVFRTSGTPADWITLKNYPGQSPLIQSEWWDAIHIGNGSSTVTATTPALAYLEVRGLHVKGDASYVPTTYPTLINQVQPQTNGNGITVNGYYETNHPHDIRFADNIVEYCSGGGIVAAESDRIQIEDNITRYNCWWTIYGPSGISILSAYNFEGTSNTYTRLVQGNESYGNQCFEFCAGTNSFSDGNGIILDVNHNTAHLPNGVTVGRTMVDNNVCFDNGGSGIHCFVSSHVDVFNNTTYMNSASRLIQYGEIFAGGSTSDDRIYNNIMVAPVALTGQLPEPVNSGPASYFQNNIYFGGNTAPVMGTGDRIVDPQFVTPSIDPATADFRLRSTSPAIDTGGTTLAPYLDFAGNVRAGIPDIGAYEYVALTGSIPTVANAVPNEVTNTTTLLSIIAGNSLGPAPITYSWSTTAKPAGSTAPVISPGTGTGLTNVSTATFSSSGTYTFTLTLTDANAVVTTYPVTVNVFSTMPTITITPSPKTIAGGTTQQFSAALVDQFGAPMTRTVTWATNTSAGSINTSTGLFTASQTGGIYKVSASNNLVTTNDSVTVVPTVYTATGAGYYVRLASDAVTEQIWVGTPGNVGPANASTPTYAIALASLPSLSFGPASGNEALTIDLANGKPLPAGAFNFNGSSGTDSLAILGSSGSDSVTVNATQILFGPTPITYSNIESISASLGAGSDTLTQSAQPGNGATLTLLSPTSSDSLVVSGGTFTLPASATGITKVSLGSVSVSSGAALALTASTPHTTRLLLAVGTLTLPPTATLDLGGNDMIVSSTSSNLTTDAYTGLNSGTGLITSAPVGNSLKAVGINISTGQSFDNQSTAAGDTLIKTTYFGDATLDGKVDGTDYSRIDAAYLNGTSTGWYNGDFNYDGVVDGSDYTLIDNAYNSQGAPLAAEIATTAAKLSDNLSATKPEAVAITPTKSPTTEEKKTEANSLAQELEQITVL
jgi:hypothetical protein